MRREDRKKQIRFRVLLTVTAIAAAVIGVLCVFVYLRYGRQDKEIIDLSAASSAVSFSGTDAADAEEGQPSDAGGAQDNTEVLPAEEEAPEDPAAEEETAQGSAAEPAENASAEEPAEEPITEYPSASEEYLRTLPWNLTLVNSEHPLPEGYEIPELSWIDSEQAVDSRAYDDLMAMLDAAHEAGTTAFVLSSFREHDKQVELYTARVWRFMNEEGCTEEEAQQKAAGWVAIPGTSEHELGLAADIVDAGYAELEDDQADTPSQQWLMAHCMEYGFILRYPEDKTDITGIGNEPWHYRYVGKEAAAEMYEHGFCLEEYIDWLASGVGDD